MSWLFVAGLTLSNAAVRAVETIEAQDVSSVSIEPNAVKPTDAANVWSWPDAITKTIGREPVTEWKEYLFKDPFGEGKDAIESSNLPPGLRKPKNNKGDQINWKSSGVRGSWMPSITCPYGGSMDVDYYGKEKCIGIGQGICKDGWQFGIRQHIDNTYLMLWREDDPMNPVYKWFPGATQLCIGELYPNIAYLRITYEDNLYFLIGRGAGDPNHLARLKIVPTTTSSSSSVTVLETTIPCGKSLPTECPRRVPMRFGIPSLLGPKVRARAPVHRLRAARAPVLPASHPRLLLRHRLFHQPRRRNQPLHLAFRRPL